MSHTALPDSDALRPRPADVLPRGVLLAIGVLVLVSLAGTAVVRLSGLNIREPDARTVATRALRFDDGADGSVVITDGSTGQPVARISGEQGFLRGTLRAMARERRRSGLDAGPAFQLVARADGRLTLLDPATGQRIDLESFGPTNAAVFARLLPGAAQH
jgi:putative photosynthetic complex assembly protein